MFRELKNKNNDFIGRVLQIIHFICFNIINLILLNYTEKFKKNMNLVIMGELYKHLKPFTLQVVLVLFAFFAKQLNSTHYTVLHRVLL